MEEAVDQNVLLIVYPLVSQFVLVSVFIVVSVVVKRLVTIIAIFNALLSVGKDARRHV